MMFAETTETTWLTVLILGGLGLLALFVYFGPFFVALARRHNSAAAIFLVCLFFGWSVVGWLVALIWSFADPGPD
jgi:hypothetical protein